MERTWRASETPTMRLVPWASEASMSARWAWYLELGTKTAPVRGRVASRTNRCTPRDYTRPSGSARGWLSPPERRRPGGRDSAVRRNTAPMGTSAPVEATAVEAESTAWAPRFGAPVRSFLEAESGGAIALIAAVALALLWANLPWHHTYETFWSTHLTISLGLPFAEPRSARMGQQGPHDGLLPGRGPRGQARARPRGPARATRIRVPIAAALWGMALPIGIYLAVNGGGAGADAWGAAMSTDTALALGVLTLVASGPSTRLRVFLLTLAVTDDLVSLAVIALAYTTHLKVVPLIVALALFAALFLLRFAGRFRGQTAMRGWRRGLARARAVGHRPGHLGPRCGPRDERLSPQSGRPRSGDRTDALLSRAAHARARLLGSAQPGVGGLGQRARAVPPASVDELRDRASVRARERGRPHRRDAAARSRELARDAGDRARLCPGQARQGSWRARGSPRDPGSAGPAGP